MLSSIWNTLLYQPFVNILAFLISIIPGGDVGIAIILLTFLVKLLLFPLSQKSLENQAKTSALSPLLNEIKASGATKEEHARRTFELYKKHKANPFSGCLLENQAKTSALSPLLNEIKASGATKEEHARRTFELYKKHKANPFSGCLLVLVQIPVIFALYFVFYKGIAFDGGLLYSFVHIPDHINMTFLG